jgi:Fur family ferric uptake transcriptional regulator
LLDAAGRPMSRHDIESALGSGTFDRVTLYRTLDPPVEDGLVLRSVDERRVSRVSAAAAEAEPREAHAHFRSEGCGRVFCLAEVRTAQPRLPAGFRGFRTDLSVRGLCPACAAHEP